MKYYIPISSLNLDNILQAESISPSSFYAWRKTGYNNFEVIPELRGINPIVLFEYPVRFSINDPNRYNDPILIEIEDEQQLCSEAIHHCENGVCSYNKTLHLTSYNCRIFFFSERAYKIATINTKDNKSIKNYGKYRIYPTAEKLGELKKLPLVKNCVDQRLGESFETRDDKKKGVLYAYLLGQNMSLTPELARQKHLTQEIYNTITGIKAYGNASDELKKNLETYLEAYKRIDKIELKNRATFDEKLKNSIEPRFRFLENCLIHWLRNLGVWNLLHKTLSNQWDIPTLPSIAELVSVNDYLSLRDRIEEHTRQSITEYKHETSEPSLLGMMVKDGRISIENKHLLNIAINYIIDNELTPDMLTAKRKDICSGIVDQIKNYFMNTLGYSKNQWDNDPHRKYALQLYYSIDDFRIHFLLNDAKELEYSTEFMAIAAFLLHGHNIDSYLKYLVLNEVADYSMPLALWGALCGYMEMNRDLLSEIMTDETYEKVYEHLYGINIYKATFNDTVPNLDKSESKVLTNDYLFVIERAKITIYSKLKDSLNGEYIDIQDIEKVLAKCNKRQLSQCDKAREIFNLMVEKPIDQDRLKEYIVGKKKLSEVSERLGISIAPANKPKRNKTNKKKQDDFSGTFDFSGIIPKSESIKQASIIDDDNACNIINGCASLGNETKHITEMFIEFQKKYRPGGYYYEHSDQYRRNNSDVIDHFCKWCLSSKNSNAVQKNQTNSRIFDELKRYLLKCYHD